MPINVIHQINFVPLSDRPAIKYFNILFIVFFKKKIIFFYFNNNKLVEALKLIQSWPTSGSLAAYDNFNYAELYQFRKAFFQEVNDTIAGSEPFPGEMLTPCRSRVALPDNIYQILTDYYNDAYELQFATIAEISASPKDTIVVPNVVNQFGRVRILAEIFGSVMAPRYLKNANVLANFIQNNETIDLFPGQVQYYFEHTMRISGELKTHRLAFVKWYKPAPANSILYKN